MRLALPPLIAELSPLTAFLGNGIVLAALVGMVAFGWRQGLFVTTVVALGCLAAFVGALAGTASASQFLIELELPGSLAPAAGYWLVLAGLLLGLQAGFGRWLPEQAVWMGGLGMRLAACGVGGIAGAILAAAALIGWTMLPLPATLRLRPDELAWDPGPWALTTFARCVEPTPAGRETILGARGDGEPPGLLDHYRSAAWREVDEAAADEAAPAAAETQTPVNPAQE